MDLARLREALGFISVADSETDTVAKAARAYLELMENEGGCSNCGMDHCPCGAYRLVPDPR